MAEPDLSVALVSQTRLFFFFFWYISGSCHIKSYAKINIGEKRVFLEIFYRVNLAIL